MTAKDPLTISVTHLKKICFCPRSKKSLKEAVIGEYTVFFGDKPEPLTHSSQSLGIEIDENLNWEKHIIEKICKKASAGIGAMKRAKPYVDANTLQTNYIKH